MGTRIKRRTITRKRVVDTGGRGRDLCGLTPEWAGMAAPDTMRRAGSSLVEGAIARLRSHAFEQK